MPVLNALEHGTRCVVTTRDGQIVNGWFRGIEVPHGDQSILVASTEATHSIPVESVLTTSTLDPRGSRTTSQARKGLDMFNRLHVGNLSFDTTAADLVNLFAGHGAVKDATVVTDQHSGRSRGFGFVEMVTPEEANTAIGALDGHNLDGRDLTVAIAKPRSR